MTNPEDFATRVSMSATEREKASPVWDMSQERAFMEQMLNQRFNFFMVFFSLVVGGAANTKQVLHMQIILVLGSVVCLMLAAVLRRSQEKLDLIIADLFSDPSHPATIIDARTRKTKSRRRLVGVAIPTVCCFVLVLGAALSLAGKLG